MERISIVLIFSLFFLPLAKGQVEKGGYFPKVPDLPPEIDPGIFVVFDNVSHIEKAILKKDIIGHPLEEDDGKFLFDEASELFDPNKDVDVFEGDHFEGDIFGVSVSSLGEFVDDSDELLVRNAVVNNFQKWPGGRIPYVISSSFSQRDRTILYRAMKEFEKHSCIRWEPKDRLRDQDYVHIIPDSGCYSRVGRGGSGAQILSLGQGCVNVGTAIHEMLHAAGFWHEQSRPDRNDYIQVVWANIKAGYEDNFARYDRGEVSTLELEYDTQSVMHYSSRAFTKNGQNTIVPLSSVNQAAKLGQRIGFSHLDLKKLNRLYECPKTGETLPQECKDFYSKGLCYSWFNQNGCFEHKEYMEAKCPKTCGFCHVDCVDKEESCASLALFKGQCDIDPEYMHENCPRSCGICHKFYDRGLIHPATNLGGTHGPSWAILLTVLVFILCLL